MKTSALFTAICLIVLAQCAFSLKCFFCTSKTECAIPTIETCKKDGDVCLNVKLDGQALVKGCAPGGSKASSIKDFFYAMSFTDYQLASKMPSMNRDQFEEIIGANFTTPCDDSDLCNSSNSKTVFFPLILTAFLFFFV